jgi:ppGpp synthetase/RelA/SpoT-type nucleotidyltranferase
MANYPLPTYSKKLVIKAGKVLANPMPWDETRANEYINVFRVAWDWRNSHAYPMRKMRAELSGKIRKMRVRGVTAGRMKRMQSIRKKLARLNANLTQIQDIGGYRAIMESSDAIKALLAFYRSSECPHKCREDRSYIDQPRIGGYRSHHFVFEFIPQSQDEEIFVGRRIELQIRSRLQHSWATAVEAIGLVRNEDMKAGEGDRDWLRFFELMSSEFAETEGAPLVPYAPAKRDRIAELKSLDKKLGAVRMMEHLNQAFKFTESNLSGASKYFMIQYDNIAKTVDVVGYINPISGVDQYANEEYRRSAVNTVLVEVDTVASLKEAYPNYFLDVRLFTQNVLKAIKGQPLDLVLKKEDLARTAHGYDLNWLRKFIVN